MFLIRHFFEYLDGGRHFIFLIDLFAEMQYSKTMHLMFPDGDEKLHDGDEKQVFTTAAEVYTIKTQLTNVIYEAFQSHFAQEKYHHLRLVCYFVHSNIYNL